MATCTGVHVEWCCILLYNTYRCIFILWFEFHILVTVKIVTQPSNVTVCNGGEADFSCVISGPGVARNFITTAEWQIMLTDLGGFVSVLNRGRHVTHQTIRNDTLTVTLIITNVSFNDSGVLYRCMVTESVISTSVSVFLSGKIGELRLNISN